MSLAIGFKSAEGIVLAVDSRVTINARFPQKNNIVTVVPSTFDNATKLLRAKGQNFVGAVTYGVGALGQQAPRTAASFMPEFESDLLKRHNKRLNVEEFSKELSNFFLGQWKALMMPKVPATEQMMFLVGGFDEDAVYGRIFEFSIPGKPDPTEFIAGVGDFGVRWGGQHEFVSRLMNGFDLGMLELLGSEFGLNRRKDEIEKRFNDAFSAKIPYQFLPLQDCVDLSIFLIKTTIVLQKWIVGIRGVGGAIDVATITRTEGFKAIQEKKIAPGGMI